MGPGRNCPLGLIRACRAAALFAEARAPLRPPARHSVAFAGLRALTGGALPMADQPLSARVSRGELVREAVYVGGRFAAPAPGDSMFEVRDPASGAVLGCVPDLDAAASAAAVDAAAEAFGAWRSVPARDKGAALRRWHDLIVANTDDLAQNCPCQCRRAKCRESSYSFPRLRSAAGPCQHCA